MLQALIDHYDNGNKSQFAKRLGVSAQGVSTWLSRGTLDIELIYSKCENLNSQWLLTGRGDMLADPAEPAHSAPENSPEGIPLIPLSAMAGAFTGETSVMDYECERYVIPAFKGADFLIQVKGDSMRPTYYSGDLVACRRVPMADLFFQWNKVYVIDTNQGALVKRIKPGSDRKRLQIVSDNEKYDPFELPISSIHAVALVIGVIRLE